MDRTKSQTNGTALLFHGAGGDTDAPVLLAVRDALLEAGWDVARLDQPYRVAGRRAPDRAPHLDAVATQVAEMLPRPLLLVGKSSGARVACRIAASVGAVGVVALGFPLNAPGNPEKSRAGEIFDVRDEVPVLVVQGSRDSFGAPHEFHELKVRVHEVAGGDHSFVPRKGDGRTLRECLDEVARVVVAEAQART